MQHSGAGPKRRPWALVARDLIDNPGQWGVVLDDNTSNTGSAVARINNGLTRWFQPAGAFLAVSRTLGATTLVYAVYLGENHEYAKMANVESMSAA